ncbi:MAG: wax ester/triacylglycerol synthase family O-acyltransferase [Gammaproteobacteria bacterium]
MRQLSGSDAFFLYADKPGQHQHVSTVYLYDPGTAAGGEVPFEDILERVRSRLPLSSIFRRRLARVPFELDYPYWIEDPDFELEYHVRQIALPAPGDWRQLCIQLSRLHSRALNLTRPVWEMYVIEGLDRVESLPPGAFAIMVKVHHAALDDATETDFTAALHESDPDAEPAYYRDQWHPEAEPGLAQIAALAWFNNTTKLIESGQSLLDFLPFVGARRGQAGDLLHGDEAAAPLTRFGGEISAYRVWNARFFPLDEVEAIARSIEGAGGGAGSEHAPGHRVQLLRVDLCTTVADPLERLREVTRGLAEVRAAARLGGGDMDELQDSLPSPTMALLARAVEAGLGPGRHFREDHNTIISLVPGPDRPLYLCGARLIGFTGMGTIVDNLALNHTVTRYDGRLGIAAVCDRAIMRRPNFYGRCLDAAFEELAVAARDKADRGKASGRGTSKRSASGGGAANDRAAETRAAGSGSRRR